MRIAVIGDNAQPVRVPFAGGMESMTWYLCAWLARHGHEVTLWAAPRSVVPGVEVVELDLDWQPSDVARHDISMPPAGFIRAHHAYLKAVKQVSERAFDVVQIHALHHLPVALAELTGVPTVLTLHSPPTPWLESSLQVAGARRPHLVSVSRANRALWAETVEGIEVILNGVDLDRWQPGPGSGDTAIWSGRIVPEKAPHLAIAAVRRAGLRLRMAGPIEDPTYYDAQVAPLLGADVTYEGCLSHGALSTLVGRSRVSLQTPRFDEPFCLAAAEAMACGTPVAAFARGGLTEVIGVSGGALAEPGDVSGLADAVTRASGLDRAAVRAQCEERLSLSRCGNAYVELYERLVDGVSGQPDADRVIADQNR